MVVALALAACGARGTLEAESGAVAAASTSSGSGGSAGSGGSTPAEPGRIQPDCAPNDGPAIRLVIDGGASTCFGPESTGLYVYIYGADLVNLQAGATLTIGDGVSNAETSASRIVGPTQQVVATGGTVSFSAFAKGASAAGSYHVTFTDGSTLAGSFAAVWCSGVPGCG